MRCCIYCIFFLYQLRIKPIQYYLYKYFHKRSRCWSTPRSLALFSGQSVGPELMCEHVLNMLHHWLFSLSQLQTSMQKYPVFSRDGMRTNAKIFLSQIEFLFSYQLITCIRCLLSVCCLKNRYNMGKYVWHKPDGLIFVFVERVEKIHLVSREAVENVVLPGKNKNYFSILINY